LSNSRKRLPDHGIVDDDGKDHVDCNDELGHDSEYDRDSHDGQQQQMNQLQ
jgi:hypothetical protein